MLIKLPSIYFKIVALLILGLKKFGNTSKKKADLIDVKINRWESGLLGDHSLQS